MLPIATTYGETAEKPTADTTLSSVADPLKVSERIVDTAETKESSEPTAQSRDEQKTENSSQPKKEIVDRTAVEQGENKTISPRAVTLKEGNPGDAAPYDIDANLAKMLRTVPDASTNQSIGTTLWSGYGKAENMLTFEDMESLIYISVPKRALTSLKGIEFAKNLRELWCADNQLQELDVSNNTALVNLACSGNQLTTLDVTSNLELKGLNANRNDLAAVNLSGLTKLEDVGLYHNQLSTIDVSTNTNLLELVIYDNYLTGLDVTNNLKLQFLNLHLNAVPTLDVSRNTELTFLNSSRNLLPTLDVTKNVKLTTLYTSSNKLPELDVSQNVELKFLTCGYNQLSSIDVSNNPKLVDLSCGVNQITALDFSKNPDLRMVQAERNQLSSLNVSNNPKLEILSCERNQLTELDVSQNPVLVTLECFENQISDITSANGLANLTTLEASDQKIRIPVPVVINKKTDIDILKTTTHAGLTAKNGDFNEAIVPEPTFSIDGDVIKLDEVTRTALIGKSINFNYDGTQLTEGNSATTKNFSGTIYFDAVSELDNQITAASKKVKSGEKVQWKWTITSLLPKKAENIHGTLDLPSNLTIIPDSIKIDGVTASINDINGTNSLGALDKDEVKVITFTTTAKGTDGDWLKAKARVNWEDDTVASPYFKEAEDSVQIQKKDVEKPSEPTDVDLLSAPIAFNYGVKKVQAKESAYTLDAAQYQKNKEVIEKGFYTRMKDDRTTSTGWKLTAQLSEFKDSSKEVMPNSSGAALNFDGLTIESVVNRDTPQESTNPSATGTPSQVKSKESLVAGDSPTTLVSAKAGEGKNTWQLRIPFEKISLNLPANAGKKGSNYQAKITWSLDDTP